MPLEIKELHIKATIISKKNDSARPQEKNAYGNEKMKKELIKECVREVLQILDDKKER